MPRQRFINSFFNYKTIAVYTDCCVCQLFWHRFSFIMQFLLKLLHVAAMIIPVVDAAMVRPLTCALSIVLAALCVCWYRRAGRVESIEEPVAIERRSKSVVIQCGRMDISRVVKRG